MCEAWEPSKSDAVSEMTELSVDKYFWSAPKRLKGQITRHFLRFTRLRTFSLICL
jgi:hypothetical protein